MHLLTLSAKSDGAMRELAQAYETYLKAHPEASLADVCFTANTGRTHFNHRLTIVTESRVQLLAQLKAFCAGRETAGLVRGQVSTQISPRIAFLFTGQGSQYADMGRHLFETHPRFRQTIKGCDEILRPYLAAPLIEVLYSEQGKHSRLNKTAYTQPAFFALEFVLVELWQSWGIQPAIVMGHSLGEYVAACVAGVFGLEEALKLVAEQSRLMQNLPQDGEMVAVFADEARVTTAIQPHAREISIAGVNGPERVVISGERDVVRAVTNTLKAEGVKAMKLKVSHVFHSPLVEPMLEAFERIACNVSYSSPRISMVSIVTGELVKEEVATSEYWCGHLQQPVRFAKSMETLHQLGYKVFIEIGPKPTLLGMGRRCLPADAEIHQLASLSQGRSDWRLLLQSLGELYVCGVAVDWSDFDRDYSRRRTVLPAYPWQRSRYWIDNTENERSIVGAVSEISPKSDQTSIVNLLNQGDIKQLTQQIEKTSYFSEEQRRLLPQLLEAVVEQHQRELTTASIGDWLYRLEWQPTPREAKVAQGSKPAHEPGRWLIFAVRQGMGQALSELLQERSQSCILVYAGEVCRIEETGTYSVNPSVLTAFERLFQDLLGNPELPPLKGVVHLWSLEAPAPEELTIHALKQVQL